MNFQFAPGKLVHGKTPCMPMSNASTLAKSSIHVATPPSRWKCPVRQSAEEDGRQIVTLPEQMKTHTLTNMRDHLSTLQEIQSALAAEKYDEAGKMAEQRLGMSSLEAHKGNHMAPFRPDGMNRIGWEMHKAASRFALIAQETTVDRNLPRAIGALSEVTQQCVACHTGYRLK